MPKICVSAPEIVMSGDIAISASMAVTTKAKLDSVTISGDCSCGEAPPPTPPPPAIVTDYVIVIDGSDSYNNKITRTDGSVDADNAAFGYTKQWASGLIRELAAHEKAEHTTFTLIQFSGYKKLEKDYVPGSDGDAGRGLKHWQVEIAPTGLEGECGELCRQACSFDGLDGNGQLFLCLQDISMASFQARLQAAHTSQYRRTCLIVVSDEEWDIRHLASAPEFGSGTATAESVCASVHAAFDSIHAVVVRPNRYEDQNEEFIQNTLCKAGKHYYKVYTDAFENEMNVAGSAILNNMDYANEGMDFFRS